MNKHTRCYFLLIDDHDHVSFFINKLFILFKKFLSTLKLARRFLYIIICFSLLHGIPLAIFIEIQSSRGCNIYNLIYLSYHTYFYFIGLIGIIPASISSIFSLLVFCNILHIVRRQISIARRRLDQQLTIMALLRTICSIISRIYYLREATSQNPSMKTAIIHIIGSFAHSLVIFNYAAK